MRVNQNSIEEHKQSQLGHSIEQVVCVNTYPLPLSITTAGRAAGSMRKRLKTGLDLI